MLSKSSKKILESSLKDYEINIFKSKMSFMLLDRIHNQQREINIVYIFLFVSYDQGRRIEWKAGAFVPSYKIKRRKTKTNK